MARRLIQTIRSATTQDTAKIYRDVEWSEYRVVFSWSADGDYHTDDKADALGTAQVVIDSFDAQPLKLAA